ncbi:hypothetical protein AB0C74_38535 [Spirillospora sp. NPDC048832]
MPDSAPDPDHASAGLAHRLRTDRKWQLGTVAAALVLVLGVAAVVVAMRPSEPAGISDGPLAAAPAAADTVPAGRIVKEPPADCGVAKATAARLAPGSDPDASATRRSRSSPRPPARRS